ncbi:MAG TPA: LamG-like jellyroll fold domain-containing protein [Verrucomicrobiae bacterium]|nr:LamG-like jellyroll fold domain-containing protein [Verrucomicrobiae bacterium]
MKTNTIATTIDPWRGTLTWSTAAILLVFLAFVAGTARAQTNIIYQDTFARTGLLNGTAPDTVNASNAVWWASTNTLVNSALYTDGSEVIATNYPNPSNGYYINGFLPFTPQVGHKYTYAISAYGIIGGNQWLALGFALNEITNNYYAAANCGAAWLLVRASGANYQPFLGPGTTSGSTVTLPGGATTNTFTIVLDTTTGTAISGWTVSWYANGILGRQAVYGANPAIHYVGCGVDAATGYFQQFSLTDYAAPSTPPTISEQPQNATVSVGQKATFWVNATGIPSPTYQWRTNSISGITNNITGATSVTYTTPALTPAYNALQYSVTVANFAGSTNSAPATLTVTNTPATVFSATKTASGAGVVVAFSKPVDPTTGLNAANYSLNNGASVLSASYGGTASNSVILTTTMLNTNSSYSLAVQSVQDLFGNTMTNTTAPVLPAGLAIYLRGDSGVILDNSGNVAEWLDQTTNGNNMVQYILGGASARPALGSINSEPVLNFNSSSSNFLTAATSPSLAITNNMSIYAFVNFADLSAPREILSKTTGAQAAPYDYYASTGGNEVFYRGEGQNSGQFTSAAGASAGASHVLAVMMTGVTSGSGSGTVTHYLDGNANGSGTLTVGNPSLIADTGNPLWLGGRNDEVQWMNGQIGEILIFNSALSDADRISVDNYLGLKYFSSYTIITDLPASTTSSNGFAVTYTFAANWGSAHLALQWQENGTNIPGATGMSYTTPILSPSDNGDTFDVAVMLPNGSTIYSTTNTLTVLNMPPYVTSAGIPIWSTTNIIVLFDEAVTPATATVAANYSLNNGASVLSASIGDTPNKLVLTTSALTWSANPGFYTLTIQNVKDLYGNTVVTGSTPVGVYPQATALWVRADTGVTTNTDGTVTQWNDMSGNGNNLQDTTFFGFTDPLLTNSAGGDMVVHFAATNGTYGSALYANDAASLRITGDMSVIAVVNFGTIAGGTNGEIISKTGQIHPNVPAPYDYYVNGTAALTYRGNGNTGTGNLGLFAATTGPSLGTPHIIAFSETGNTVNHFLDGKAAGTGILNNSFSETNCGDQGQPVFVGGRGDFVNNHLSGDISELIVVGSSVSKSDLTSLGYYLIAKHNLPIIIPSSNPTNIFASATGNQITLTWPMDHTGWQLQSNSVGLMATNAWFTVAGSTATNQMIITPNPAKTNVFYRLFYQAQ